MSGCRPESEENRIEERESIVFSTQQESSSDDLFFTEKEVTQIEAEVLNIVFGVWDQYENLIYDDSPDANASGIADFTKEQRLIETNTFLCQDEEIQYQQWRKRVFL